MFKRFLFLFLIAVSFQLNAIFPMNYFRYAERGLLLNWREKDDTSCLFFNMGPSEGGIKIDGRNDEGEKVNFLQIWNKNQDSLAMLRGFGADTTIGKLAAKVGNISNDIDDRGRFLPTANLDFVGNAVELGFKKCSFSLSAYLPYYYMKLKNVEWESLTKDPLVEDSLVKKGLAANFKDLNSLTESLGGLKLGGWTKSGIGDLVFMGRYFRDFQQRGRQITNVKLHCNLGLSVPTAKLKNEDYAFDIPFGNDGAWAMYTGAGLEVTWWNFLRGGGSVQFLQIFGTTKERRIMTDKNQTDLLFLAKCKAYKDYGFTPTYMLFLEAVTKPVQVRVSYQHLKHSRDSLSLLSNTYSNDVANEAPSLKEWTNHQFIFSATFDFFANFKKKPKLLPKFYTFYKLPFNGKRMVQAHTFGGGLSFDF